jgi:DNA-binding transcriptional MerR regulator
MPAAHQTPCFNLKAVVQQTGLKRDTLRAWERRYGLPKPKRSEGGHRLYSERDIRIIKWLVARQREGLSIKRAVELWRSLEAEGRGPLQDTTFIAPQATAALVPQAAGDTLAKLREAWVTACSAFDEQSAEQVLAQAFALYSPEGVCLEVLQKAMAEIGEGWYRGETTAHQEHFASALAMRRLEALIMAAPAPTRPGLILVGCPPEEEHTLSLLLLTFLLRRQGWEVLYLGASVPVADMKATVIAVQPQLVILAAQRLHTAATLFDMAQLLGQERTPLAFGGRIFNILPALVEAHLWGTARPEGIPSDYLTLANAELGRNIVAALTLGDMAFLDADIDWLRGLLRNLEIPAKLLYDYFDAYYRAAQKHVDERGRPVVAWLAKLTDNQVQHSGGAPGAQALRARDRQNADPGRPADRRVSPS